MMNGVGHQMMGEQFVNPYGAASVGQRVPTSSNIDEIEKERRRMLRDLERQKR